jgi:cellulose synthase/poly-beta-1,6-N-acetylglucosamine synthase-like glycosyltransferase
MYILLAISLAGLLGMTILFPLLSALIGRSKRVANPVFKDTEQPRSILIAIPAHNEERTITATLESVFEAVEAYTHRFPSTEVEVKVGLDACTDRTARLVKTFETVTVTTSEQSIGKWGMLQKLLGGSNQEWVVFADAGVVWPSNLLIGLAPALADKQVVGANPTYRSPSTGLLDNLSWKFEAMLKHLEGSSGGPISAHGATVAYRRAPLQRAFTRLEGTHWFNDDVVLPLALRLLFPDLRFEYLSAIGVADGREAMERGSSGVEFRRRTRMVVGNAQWMASLLPAMFRENRVAGLVALRRVFRLFWAYWGLCFSLAVLALIGFYSTELLFTCLIAGTVFYVLAAIKSSSVRSLTEAACASLLAPYFLLFANRREVAWR